MAGASRLPAGSFRASQSDRRPYSSSSPLVNFPSDDKQRGGKEKKMNKLEGISDLISTSCQFRQHRSRAAASISELDATSNATADGSPSMTRLATNARDLIYTTSRRLAVSSMIANNIYRWKALRAELLIEKGIIGCQSFTLIAVAGSLIGSILCFVEGCFLVLESFFQYFHAISHKVDQGGIIHLLIEATDMYLVGTALLTFGMSMYVMFAAPNKMKQQSKGWPTYIATSNLFGLFNLQRLLGSMGMHSISQAKSKIGHAVVLILQTGLMEKMKTMSLTTSFDLACFAGAILVSSASIFLLSKLTVPAQQNKHAHI